MPVIITRQLASNQPQYPVAVDFGNPIAKDIVFAFEASQGQRNLVNSVPGEALGTGVTIGAGRYGRQINFSGSQGNRSCSFGVDHSLDGATQATWDILVYFSGANPGSHFFGQWDANLQWLLQGNGGGGLVWVAADDNAGNRRRWDISSGVFTSAGWYRIIASWQGGSNAFVLVNGVSRAITAVNTAATNIGTNNTSDYLQIGTVSGGTPLNGSVAFARAWKRGLSQAECISLSNSPWQIFAKSPISVFAAIPASGGNGVGTGSASSVSLSSVSASATTSSLASSSVPSVSISNVSGSAIGTSASNGNATGSVVAISLNSPSAYANGSARASSTVAYVSLSSVSGSAFATNGSTGSGDVDSIAISAATAIAVASSVASGGVQSIGITAPNGYASSASANGSAYALIDDISISEISGSAITGQLSVYGMAVSRMSIVDICMTSHSLVDVCLTEVLG